LFSFLKKIVLITVAAYLSQTGGFPLHSLSLLNFLLDNYLPYFKLYL
jgi:hypothetical protein